MHGISSHVYFLYAYIDTVIPSLCIIVIFIITFNVHRYYGKSQGTQMFDTSTAFSVKLKVSLVNLRQQNFKTTKKIVFSISKISTVYNFIFPTCVSAVVKILLIVANTKFRILSQKIVHKARPQIMWVGFKKARKKTDVLYE